MDTPVGTRIKPLARSANSSRHAKVGTLTLFEIALPAGSEFRNPAGQNLLGGVSAPHGGSGPSSVRRTAVLSQTLRFLGPEASPRGGERGNQDHSGKSWEAWDECWVNIIAQANRVNGYTGWNAEVAGYQRKPEPPWSKAAGNRLDH